MSSLQSTVRRVGGPVAASVTILALVIVNTAAPVGAQSAPCDDVGVFEHGPGARPGQSTRGRRPVHG